MMDESTRQRLNAIRDVLIWASDRTRVEIVSELINIVIGEISFIDCDDIDTICHSLSRVRDEFKRFYE